MITKTNEQRWIIINEKNVTENDLFKVPFQNEQKIKIKFDSVQFIEPIVF